MSSWSIGFQRIIDNAQERWQQLCEESRDLFLSETPKEKLDRKLNLLMSQLWRGCIDVSKQLEIRTEPVVDYVFGIDNVKPNRTLKNEQRVIQQFVPVVVFPVVIVGMMGGIKIMGYCVASVVAYVGFIAYKKGSLNNPKSIVYRVVAACHNYYVVATDSSKKNQDSRSKSD
jgi:hypothetical protein